ncbi:MAG: histidinol-phosphatase, partial [Pygmaiobacter sp.]
TTVSMLNKYVESSVRGMEDGLYAYFAHPDLFMRSYPLFDENAAAASREICRAAKRLGMPLEYNLAGMIFNRATGIGGYPHNKFWEIAAAEGCTAIVGVDAHDNRHFAEEGIRSAAEQLLRKLGMPLIDTIPFLTEV